MGAQQCRCQCDKEGEEQASVKPVSISASFDEETVSSLKPRAPLAEAFPGDAIVTASKKEEPPAATAQSLQPEDAFPQDNLRSVDLVPQAGSKLAIDCIAYPAPPPLGTLVVTSEGNGLHRGDVVREVDGQSGLTAEAFQAMIANFKNIGGQVTLKVVSRPKVFDVELNRVLESTMMGILVAVHLEMPDRIEVRKVTQQGAMAAWNELHMTSQVMPGDWVTAVGGEANESARLVEEMQLAWREGSVVFTVRTHEAGETEPPVEP